MLIVICAAGPATPVAEKFTGEPVKPSTVAVSVFAPATVPSVQLVRAATPLAFVATVAGDTGLIVPPPEATTKFTATPATGLLLASLTTTLGAVATAVPAVADWLFPAFTVTCVAGPGTTIDCVAMLSPPLLNVRV